MIIDKVYECREKCCGCEACMNACPTGAITMQLADDGYLYPVVDKEKCVGCGLCKGVCQYGDEAFVNNTLSDSEMDIYAAHGNDEATSGSTSGGLFYVLAQYVLSKGGVVYGAAYDENMVVRQVRAETGAQLQPIRRSKYVQSSAGFTYRDAKAELDKGRLVLYSGTPCQLAGLYGYLGRDYSNLISAALICYGTTPPKMFSEYVNILEEKHGAKMKFFDFRDKTDGWGNKYIGVEFDDVEKSYILPTNQDPYRRIFNTHHITRATCNTCKYAYMKRFTDFALGDYWGIEKTDSKIDSYKGLSKVFVATQKGRAVFDEIKNQLVFEKMPYDTAVRPNLSGKGGVSPVFDRVLDDYKNFGFKYIMKKYMEVDL